ncbi:MAG: DnaJ domain-containing protein [Deltaproteobacteria bacterium]|nr:DnaJ domain-containing protein [Deltaproteobacteria bacterium]
MPANDLEAKRHELREKATTILTGDHFAALGVGRSASAEEVKKAYLDRVKVWHPDRVPPGLDDLKPLFGEVFARLDAARSTLTDASARLDYARRLASGPPSDRMRAASPAEAAFELKKADVLLRKRDLAGAEEHARSAIRMAPDNPDAHAFLIGVQMAKPSLTKDDLRRLLSQLDELLKKHDRCERAYFQRGLLKKQLDMTASAVGDFARAAELNPSNVDAAREVRLHTMRKEKAGEGGGKGADAEGGVGGFLKKLFKR